MTFRPWPALAAPLAVAAATLLAWGLLDAEAALAVLALGAAGLVAFHLWNQHLVRRWASGSLDAPVPEGTGSWREVFTAIHKRVRMRAAYQRDLRVPQPPRQQRGRRDRERCGERRPGAKRHRGAAIR